MTLAPSFSTSLYLASPEQTTGLAEALAPQVAAGDVLLLSGPVGIGKSHFARALIRWRMRRADALEDVPSPTFTLVQSYPLPDGDIWHADLYRLSAPGEVEELGLSTAFEEAVCLVEWPDRLPDPPDGALMLDFTCGDGPDTRHLRITGSKSWATRLGPLLKKAT